MVMSDASYLGNLNPNAPEFIPANLHPFPPPPPSYLTFFPNFIGSLPPPPPPPLPDLPPTSFTPTRAVVISPVPANVSELSIRLDLEVFGEVRGVQMERADEGIVTVHFYNLRHSQRALKTIRELHMHREQVRFGRGYSAARGLVSGRTVWANFVFPQLTADPEGKNQGSLLIMNLEPTVSSTTLRRIFQVYGEVKELRETPFKREQRFVEFYDVRDAAKALCEMNGKSIDGKQIFIQFSRPGGISRKLFLASRFNKSFLFHHHNQPSPSPHCHQRRLDVYFRSPVEVKPSNAYFSLGDHQQYKQQQKNNNNRKRHKNHTKNNLSDGCFIINEDVIAASTVDESIACKDGRTTVMIRNIPNKYTQKLFLNMLDIHCNDCNQKIISEGNNAPMSSYDFVYLPIDFSNKCNVGYGFVNMTTPEAMWRLYKAFHNQQWRLFQSRKICEVTYARIQGVESLKEHFKNSRLPGEAMEYMPVLFSPPRDGRLLTEPISIVVELGSKPMAASCHSSVMACSSSDNMIDGSESKTAASDDESNTVM